MKNEPFVDTPAEAVDMKARAEAAVQAGHEFDWARVFAPRRGLENAITSPTLKRGSRGHRQLQT